MNIKRRDLFKAAAVGSLALSVRPLRALADHGRGHHQQKEDGFDFDFVCQSQANTIEGVSHKISMNGSGAFDSEEIEGGGKYHHYDVDSPKTPRPILSAGSWEVTQDFSFELVGTYALAASGILVVQMRLLQQIPSPAVIPAELRVVCNIGIAGLFTGEPEGFVLTIPDAPFGPFVQLNPIVGITIFNVRGEQRG